VPGRLRKLLGTRGERTAEALLKKKGYTILERNFRCASGEIDLVARDGDTLVFVEVKTRRDDRLADPADNVHQAKQVRLGRLARHWLARHNYPGRPCRFDAVAIVLPDGGGPPQVRHVVDAFTPRS